MRSPEEDVAEVIIEAVLRSLWGFRREMVFAGASGTLWFVASQRVDEVGAWMALSMLVLLVLAIGPIRRLVGRLLRHARVRRPRTRGTGDDDDPSTAQKPRYHSHTPYFEGCTTSRIWSAFTSSRVVTVPSGQRISTLSTVSALPRPK